MNGNTSQIQIAHPLSPHRRRLILALIAVLLLMKHRMDKRKRLRQHLYDDEESTYGDEESTYREEEKCAWRTRDRHSQLTREEGQRRLEKWTQEQDGIFERFYGGDGERMGMARHAYAYAYAVPLNTVAPAVPAGLREVKVEQTLKRRAVPVLPRLVDEGPAPKRRAVPTLSRGGEVELAPKRRKIRKRRVGEPRFAIKMQFEMDDACALRGRVGKGRQGVRGGPLAG